MTLNTYSCQATIARSLRDISQQPLAGAKRLLKPNKIPKKPEPEVEHSTPGVANLFLINSRQ